MKYKLNLVKDLIILGKLTTKAQDKLYVLQNERYDSFIQSKNSQTASTRKAEYIAELDSKLASATSEMAATADGQEKDRKFADVQLLQARLYKLRLPSDTASEESVVDDELDMEQQNLLIAGLQDFIATTAIRKTEIEAGN
jgi:hypothetical protein